MDALLSDLFSLSNWLWFILGALASFGVWWLTARYWTPSIRFSPELAEYELSDGDSFFQGAFENCGQRSIIDVEILVRIGIEGHQDATGWAHHIVRTNASRVPLLSSGKKRRVRVFDMRDKIEFVDIPSKSLRAEIEKCSSLRDILKLGEGGSLRIHVFGYDSFSGVRKHFQSEPYRLRDIRKGTFDGLNIVQNKRFHSKDKDGSAN